MEVDVKVEVEVAGGMENRRRYGCIAYLDSAFWMMTNGRALFLLSFVFTL
jgi:hypothetical protein